MEIESTSKQDLFWTEFGIPIKNLWYMLLYAWNETQSIGLPILNEVEISPNIDSFFAKLLTQLVQQRLRIGLGKDYIIKKELIEGVRGQIDFSESIKSLSLRKNRTSCSFQLYDPNIRKNQIIISVIQYLIRCGQFGQENDEIRNLKQKMRGLQKYLNQIDLIRLTPDIFSTLRYGRNDRDYRIMLAICELIILKKFPSDSSGYKTIGEIDKYNLYLHKIFEKFIANFYTQNLHGWRIIPQKQLKWNQKSENIFLPNMYADLLMINKETCETIILDTKFTAKSLISGLWGLDRYNPTHLYQMFTYLKSQDTQTSDFHPTSGILLYPQVNDNQTPDVINFDSFSIRIEYVDLRSEWRNIESQLMRIVLN